MHLTITFNMRAPEWGVPAVDLYAAAIDMSAWADRLNSRLYDSLNIITRATVIFPLLSSWLRRLPVVRTA